MSALPLALARRSRLASCTALLVLGMAACDDGPTSPGVYTHSAEGQLWAAVSVPDGTPTTRTWLPYLRGAGAADTVLPVVRALHSEAEQLRRSGRFEAAAEKETEAALLAVRSLVRTPPPDLVVAVVDALDGWTDRAEVVARSGLYPEAEEALREVRARRADADAALERGDTTHALVELTTAAGTVRSLAPAAVAARVVELAERRLVEAPVRNADAERALHLLRYAREALARGDEVRAFRRAMYALQLAEGRGAPEADVPQRARHGGGNDGHR